MCLFLMFVAGSWETRAEFREGEVGGGGRGTKLRFLRLTEELCSHSLCPPPFMWQRGVHFSVRLRSRVLFLLLRLQSDHALPLPRLYSSALFPHYSHTLLCVGVHYWAGAPLLASDWLAEGYEDWLCAVYSARE